MDLRHLRYFKAVAEHLNFSRAAEALRVAQPALSRQIRNLEEELGAQLLDRNRVRVQLTAAGRVFYDHTCEILDRVDAALQAARQAGQESMGQLIICNDWRIQSAQATKAVAEFRKRFPNVQIVMKDMHLHEQLAALREQRAHVGFIARQTIHPKDNIDTVSIAHHSMFVVMPENHPRATEKDVKLRDFAADLWVFPLEEELPGYIRFVREICRGKGFTPRIDSTARNLEGVFARVLAGGGVSVLPEVMLPMSNAHLVLRKLDKPLVEFCCAWSAADRSLITRNFVQIVCDQARESGLQKTGEK